MIVVDSIYTLHRPIKDVLKQAMKESDNLCAESMFYHLGAQYANCKRIGADDGTDAVNDFMERYWV